MPGCRRQAGIRPNFQADGRVTDSRTSQTNTRPKQARPRSPGPSKVLLGGGAGGRLSKSASRNKSFAQEASRGFFGRTISKRISPTPMVMAESATLKAGQ